jgi:hypothetical protein
VTTLVELRIGADPAAWRAAGFTVDEAGILQLGTVRLRFDDGGATVPGVRSWTLAGTPDKTIDEVDGLPTEHLDPGDAVGGRTEHSAAVRGAANLSTPEPGSMSPHPNSAVAIDHLVVVTPDLQRTVDVIEHDLQLRLRRTRDASASARPMRQAFFRIGEPILEVVGPSEPDPRGGPARFYGIALTVTELDTALALLGDRIGGAKPAVQPGRQIATIRDTVGLSLPVALMTPVP